MVAWPTLLILVFAYQRRWMSDDGLIYTRAVRQILAGNGPVFNTGERAEASTGTLWQWLLALLSFLSQADPGRVAVFGGLALTGAGFALALDGARRLYVAGACPRHPPRTVMPAGVLVMLALPPVWDFATSGLETGLGTCWMGAAWWCLIRCREQPAGRWPAGSAFLIGLGPMVRPDFGIAAIGFLVALWLLVRPGRRAALRLATAALALPAAYEVFRAGYYGELFPLSAVSKSAGSARWARGVAYLGDFASPYRLWVAGVLLLALAAVLVLGRRGAGARDDRVLIAVPVLCGLAMTAYVVWVGGDFMHARMLLPGLFMLLLPMSLVPVSRWAVLPAVGLGAWALVCAVAWRVPYGLIDGATGISDERAFYVTQSGTAHPDTGADHARYDPITQTADSALALRRRVLVLPDVTLVAPDVTLVPLRPDLPDGFALTWPALGVNGVDVPLDQLSVDPMGLSYPLAAHLDVTAVGRAGHDKWLPDVWLVADYGDPNASVPQGIDPVQLAAARRALSCGALAELQASARAPMTVGRFWSNLVGAVGRSSLTFPGDPVAAEREFCAGNR
jgi:arabinofuranosyltransferase